MKRKWFILPYVLVFCVINIFAQSKKPEDKFMPEWHLSVISVTPLNLIGAIRRN